MLIDVLTGDTDFGEPSRVALREARARGVLVACDVVWAELATAYSDPGRARNALDTAGVEFSSVGLAAALEAGASWRRYRSSGGRRPRIAPDFLIGAHAALQADRLLTRDRGFYRSHFAGLTVVDPSDGS